MKLTPARRCLFVLSFLTLLLCLAHSIAAPLKPVGAWPGYSRGWPLSVEVVGTRAYIAAGLGGMIIVDAADPAHPVRIGGYKGLRDDEAYRVKILGNRAYIAGHPELTIVDISDPAYPKFISRFGGGRATGLDVSGKAAYVTTPNGFQIHDPVQQGATYPIVASDVQVIGATAYLAAGNSGLVVLDVSDSAAPKKLGEYKTTGPAKAVTIVGHRAYIAADAAGLEILDITNPSLPTRLGSYDTPGNAYGISVDGNVGVVADLFQGVTVVDVTDPAAPTLLSNFPTQDGRTFDVSFAKGTAFVADWHGGLKILNLAQPASPTLLTNYQSDISG